MKDLDRELHRVYGEMNLTAKKSLATAMVNASHASKMTKMRALRDIESASTGTKIDFFMTNFMLSGEGLATVK